MDRKSLVIDLGVKLRFDVVSEHWKFSQFTLSGDHKQLEPEYPGKIQKFFGQKDCRIYLGEFAKYPLPNAPLEPRFLEVELIGEVKTEAEAKEILTKQDGYHKSFAITFEKNPHGLKLAHLRTHWAGGRNHTYILVMGKNSVLITNADFVEPESLKF